MLHDILYNLVQKHGTQVLVNPYLCGMADDMQAFQHWKERPYRLVLRGLIGQGVILQVMQQHIDDEAMLQQLSDSFAKDEFAVQNNITSSMVLYTLRALVFAAGWGKAPGETSADELHVGELAAPEVQLGEQVVPYKSHADAKEIGTMIPANMALPVNRNLNRIAVEEGSLTEFVAYELQMDEDHVKEVLSGEQIDGVAMAIRQMQVGQGFILSDATGIGKGRQLAALLYWGMLQGAVPVFVTEKSILFSDLYRDLNDLGIAEQMVPFILNNDREARVMDANGKLVVDLPSTKDIDYFKEHHVLPEGYHFLALTYSQMSRSEETNWKLPCVLDVVKDSYLILDESHNATGTTSNQGRFFRRAVADACGVTFASATYAKNCATMPLYALKTAIAESKIAPDELIDIVQAGGIILQEELSKGLVASGSMIRRERDMSDIERELRFEQNPVRVAEMRAAYDKVIEVVQDMQDFEKKFVTPYLHSLDIDEMLHRTLKLDDTVVFDSKTLHVARESFAQRLMPTIQQLLLATKTELAVQTALEVLRAGKKPVVEIQRTLESQLDFLVDINDELPSFEFAQILTRNLKAMFHFRLEASEYKPKNKKSLAQKFSDSYTFKMESLMLFHGNDEPLHAYRYLQKRIRETVTQLPISPIDYFTDRLTREGYTVAELTQRHSYLQYNAGKGPFVRVRRKRPDKKKIARDFNSGVIDVLIANRMAATGISLHASSTFADQRQRVLISLEEQASADLVEQFQGRIDRTNQVVRGAYIKLASPIAAERRFMMMQSMKLRSLSSIVRADQRNQLDLGVVDILNAYGSRVVDEYMKDHPELFDLFSELREQGVSSYSENALAVRFMRSLALLRSDDQERVLQEVEARYNELVAELNEMGENELEAHILPLEAQLKSRTIFAPGNPGSESIFGKPAYLETVEAKILRKPMTSNEMVALSMQLLDPADVQKKCSSAQRDKVLALRVRYEKLRQEAQAKLNEARLDPENHHYTPSRLQQLLESANNTDKQLEQEEKVKQEYHELRYLLGRFKKHQAVAIPMSLTTGEITDKKMTDYISMGIFLGVRLTANQVVRSGIKMVFAVNDGRRRLEIPLTQVGQIDTVFKQTGVSVLQSKLRTVSYKTWDSLLPQQAKETLYIITGNILLGIWKAAQFGKLEPVSAMKRFSEAKGKGHLIIYTDAMGHVKHGFLMPRIFRPADLSRFNANIA